MASQSGGTKAGAGAGAAQAGRPVDLAPWTYVWRADRKVQPQPEACFIPRRLERIDRVYRTAKDALPPDQLKSIYYDQPDILRRLPPKPKGSLLTGLLWSGGLSDYEVELRWQAGAPMPRPETVEVRDYPTAFGWFGWTVDRVLARPSISPDGRTWRYRCPAGELMDTSYSAHIPAATEMVAVFCEEAASVPAVSITSPGLGVWKRMDVEVEWGFKPGTEQKDWAGRLEPTMAMAGPVMPLGEDKGTIVTGRRRWRSRPAGGGRRGIVVQLLVASSARPGLDSRLTIRCKSGSATFSTQDLDKGPILVPAQGLFVSRAGSGQSARRFAEGLQERGLKTVRRMTQEHGEAASWDEVMREVRLWTCPEGTPVPRFPAVPEPAMRVHLSDEGWTDAWRAASNQLLGPHLWPALGHEIGRVARDMELLGLHAEVTPVYDYFLASPGVKSDGDFTDGKGSLEWARALRHDMGYSHEGTHASTGRLLFSMCERVFLTGDKGWFLKRRARLQAAADWIISERTRYMADVPNRDRLFVAGLMPPSMVGDYALPACDWHWYYSENALALQGLQRFADVLAEVDPAAGKRYAAQAAALRKDIRRAVTEEVILAPVRPANDGTYRGYIPRMAYARGLTGPEIGAPQFPEADLFWGSLPLAEPFAALDAGDQRIIDTVDVMDELGTFAEPGPNAGAFARPLRELEEARARKGLPTADAWFWRTYSFLPKISHNANAYLMQDDVPSFLRFWMNSYAGMVGANGKLWEHWHLGGYAPCDTPDTMTAGWFLENFRNALVMEEGRSLWVARATPRAWLEQGKTITVANAPTYFGTLAYEIRSDAGNGRITASLRVPDRTPPTGVILRLRHPKAAQIKGVTVNGRRWTRFDPAKETIRLTGLKGQLKVVASY